MLDKVHDDGQVQVWHGDCAEFLDSTQCPEQIDAVLTDPPYDDRTHTGARTNAKSGPDLVTFDSLSLESLKDVLCMIGEHHPAWVVMTCAISHAADLERVYANDPAIPDGLRYVRTGAFVKSNPMPQMTGDRPSQGFEAVAHLYGRPGKMAWNGGGHSGVYQFPVARGLHPTQKPDGLAQQWLQWFTDPGDLVLDPFGGSGWM
ncbi:MAG: DNA methyltransferase, partial [Pseudomonadota bacterium]